jgi:hypothetical protein
MIVQGNKHETNKTSWPGLACFAHVCFLLHKAGVNPFVIPLTSVAGLVSVLFASALASTAGWLSGLLGGALSVLGAGAGALSGAL